MTVSYNLDVSSTSIIAFFRLQLRWRGSIWKSVLKELTIFSSAFAIITTIYRTNHFLSEEQRKVWDNFSALFDQKLDYIPLTFMLGSL
ncbi:Bestrophin 15 [Parelaphostrongylus tenuis]|uniref:Bestrophin homolog n=1 Tax=Parelaphostrongylus tenuis TaxID=148309 RepID=A0AAD5MK20_PARTN|nr:Bestrophin 15 [Parelaphostrongylus tenuis]